MTLRLRHNSQINPRQNGLDLDSEPAPTIMTSGISAFGEYWLEDDGKQASKQSMNKPPYQVPLMTEIVALPWNGFNVASTFSGAGGSCTGYRMAGFRVIWANEFVPAAQASYKANMEPDCTLDPRDIKHVQPEEILEATGLMKGELDLFDGSPPCQAFSTAGKREKGWGKKKKYEHGASQCNETLFGEYIRLLRGLMPKVFVAENVSGLVKGTAKGYFLEILRDLKASGYRVVCRVCDAQWLGVPQQRQRTIFVGVREDLGMEPIHPTPLPYRYSVRDALPWIIDASTAIHGFTKGDELSPDKCAPSVPASASASAYTGHRIEARVIHDTSGQWAKDVDVTDKPCPAITIGVNGVNSNHFKIEQLPPSRTKPGAYGISDVAPEKPCPTVTIGSPGNDLAVPNGTEKRKFTIAELKRICAFPDDFVLTGSYTQQWERLGNSVPPVMMYYIATAIRNGILAKISKPQAA